jgi:hypothetical protein
VHSIRLNWIELFELKLFIIFELWDLNETTEYPVGETIVEGRPTALTCSFAIEGFEQKRSDHDYPSL